MLKLIKHDLPDTLNKLKLYAISDLHVGEKSFDKQRFRNFVKMIEEDKEAYCVLAGDLLNNAIVTSVSDVYSEEMSPSRALKWLKSELKPISNKILAVVIGNHSRRSVKLVDIDPIESLCEALQILPLYSPNEVYVKLTFGKNGRHKQMYGIYITHGSSGGKTLGGALSNVEKLCMSVNADIYICGHAHKKVAGKNEHRYVDMIHEKITERERLFIISSHWAKYFGGYASRMCLTPSAKGAVPIILYSKRKHFEAII